VNETATIGMGGRLHAGGSNEWWTPPFIFEGLGLDFDLDPCAPIGGPAHVPAATYYTVLDDGLRRPWEGRVFLNPPYGSEAKRWVAKLMEHGNGIALVFTRTDAKWGQAALRAADAVCFIKGRLAFEEGYREEREERERAEGKEPKRPGHNAANGSMLLAYGPECARAVLDCGLGVCLVPDRRGEQ
jgi:hypothetical protein